jgi:hypothetical protein
LRVKLADELSSVHKTRVVAMDKEVTRWRQMFFQVRREYELVRTEYTEFKVSAASDIDNAHERRASEVRGLQDAIVQMTKEKANEANRATQDDVNRLRRTVEEMGVVEDDLRSEIDRLTRSLNAAEVERHEFVGKHQNERADILSKLTMLEADKDSLLQKVAYLETNNALLKTSKNESDVMSESARQDVIRIRKVLNEREKELVDEKAVAREEVSKTRRNFDVEREQLENTVSDLRRDKQAVEERVIGLTKEVAETKREVVFVEDRYRREGRENMTQLQQTIERLESEVVVL